MTEAEWFACNDLYEMFEQVSSTTTKRKTRLLGCACMRLAWEWGLQEPLPKAIVFTEAYADGLANSGDLIRAGLELGRYWREHDEPYRPYPRTCELTEALASPDHEAAWLNMINQWGFAFFSG